MQSLENIKCKASPEDAGGLYPPHITSPLEKYDGHSLKLLGIV